MSDDMMFAIAKMPYELAMRDELSRHQFYANTQRLVAALEAARKDGWQPIETAPKDGTHVLLWFEWHDLPVVGDFRYGRWWSVHSLGGNLPRPNGMDWEEVMRPTHWMPLPLPPATEAS